MVNKEYYKLGQKIRNFRIRSGKSQMELEMEIGASAGSLSRIENGEVNPTKETLYKLVDHLDLKPIEAGSLFGLELSDISKLLKISKDILDSKDIDEILQKAVNDIINELNLLSGFITLRKGNKLYAKITTQRWFDAIVLRIISKPFESLNVDLNNDKDNLCVKAFLDKKYYMSESLDEVTVPAVSPEVSKLLAKVTGFQSGIVFPIIYKDKALGTFFVGKNYKDDYHDELPILIEFTNYIANALEKFDN